MTTHGDGLTALPLFLLTALLLPAGVAAAEASRPPRAALFRAAGFPTADAPAIDDATLATALSGLPVDTIDSPSALAARLTRADHDVLVLPYGSAFPLEAWPAIRDFVKQGGGLVVLGGAPFHQPVRQEKGAWVLGPRQPTYAHEFLIGPSDELAASWYGGPMKAMAAAGGEWDGALVEPKRTWALTVRLATREDMPGEGGSAGPRDGVVRPLVHLARREGRGAPLPAPRDRPAARDRAGRAVGARPLRRPARRGDDPQGRGARPRGRGRARRAARARGGRARRGADHPRHPAPAGAARRRGGPFPRAGERPQRRRGRGLRRRGRASAGPARCGAGAPDPPHGRRAAARPLPRRRGDPRCPLAPAGGRRPASG